MNRKITGSSIIPSNCDRLQEKNRYFMPASRRDKFKTVLMATNPRFCRQWGRTRCSRCSFTGTSRESIQRHIWHSIKPNWLGAEITHNNDLWSEWRTAVHSAAENVKFSSDRKHSKSQYRLKQKVPTGMHNCIFKQLFNLRRPEHYTLTALFHRIWTV